MNSNRIGFIASITGAIIGATFTYFMINKAPQSKSAGVQVQMNELFKRMDKTDAILSDIKIALASNQAARQELVYTTLIEQPATEEDSDSASPLLRDRETAGLPDTALEEAIIQNITTRFYDPEYMQSATLSEVMQSEEMQQLSDQARERVVVEMVGMLNRGEIDMETFLHNPE